MTAPIGPGGRPLDDLRVLQSGSGIAVAYCAKVLVDGGADVVVVEPPSGHPLRRRRPRLDGGREVPPGALFAHLHAGKRSTTGTVPSHDALAGADVWVTEELPWPWEELHERHPHLSVVAVTDFGLEGPWRSRPASDLTLQALSGGMAPRGDPARAPLMVGGEPTSWFSGAVAAASLLGVLRRVQTTGEGELLDVSQLEAAHLEHSMYPITYASMAGRPFHPARGVPIPGIEPTADGHVGFFVITGQQWLDFCALIGKVEWTEDESLFIALERRQRADELLGPIRGWTTSRTTEEIVEVASLMRIPVAPIGNGRTIPDIDFFADEGWLVENTEGFLEPRRPYRFDGEDPPAPGAVPGVEEAGAPAWSPRPRPAGPAPPPSDLPLAGVRVADFTAFWAGPLAAHVLAGLGAEVIHVEGPTRPDGIRMNTLRRLDEHLWWEWSPLFCGANTNKRDLTVDLATDEGRRIALRLLAGCDVMIENFSPRVVEQLGLGPEAAREANEDIIVVRMPAFGVSGTWRDRVGFAQTIEQASGLAFLTGYTGEAPVIPNGMCDPIAGVHAALATLVALHERDRGGPPRVVEAPMIGGALATSAEQVIEFTAHGALLTSQGNGSVFVEQSVRRCAGDDEWVALTVPDEQARADLERITAGADLDEWCASRSARQVEADLAGTAVPVARVTWAHEIGEHEQLVARRFFEDVDHPVCGLHPYVSFPTRFSAGPEVWNRHPSPTLGADNAAVLRELGYDDDRIAQLEAAGVIADSVRSSQQGW